MDKKNTKSLLRQRYDQMIYLYKEGAKALPELEKLEYMLGADLGLYNDLRREMVRMKTQKRTLLNGVEKFKSVAEFNRKFEETEEFMADKEYKFCIEGLINMKISVGNRVKALRTESKNPSY